MKPLIIKLENKKVVIFGGGSVGLRKAKYFREANLVVVSEEFKKEFKELDDIELVEKELTTETLDQYIQNSFLVIPATDDIELNEAITRKAMSKDILVNQVDGELGDVVVPSTIEDEYLLAISSYGRSPAFCKYMRKKLEEDLGPEHRLMIRLQEEMREQLKSQVESQAERKELLWRIMRDEEIWSYLRKNFYQKAVKKSREIIGERNG
ncbi:bifunctional precorrin-2 dehydrogenase/sirohydrochlorin ferrochelatase [Methanonatronarchaeum sp. AMET6-2]|uniref:precorrin-2 dehydrogenase/sirohydrochlorin ferrochelatase family protein n=1 Tax=Methanonatronarchaeum sp. AMET6-2 TaxID=2933293 RepID=UPI0012249909|nr:bifunctional precorrin-2 dehydrogenase/sirohydrochlorin ferrochelatase [Methanonatronarchaeum sp. AMET6-2]RZN60631.1 MAG: bifunctional precorrin-2 dehydrogenase/sirohydrochlorin ferrochelatase [Methanonatronarchaeia archaeon]UOY09668.1 bifunctional precorrin-2 dehydrogenase/sirohydrochlorin ferrochelatase [Methanonatronarchaeum sp. AMET6-2]